MLEDHGDFRACLPKLCIIHCLQILSFYQYGTAGGLFQKIQASDKGTLPCAAHTNDAADIPPLNVQIDAFQSLHLIVPSDKCLCHIPDLDYRFHFITPYLYTCLYLTCQSYHIYPHSANNINFILI